MFKPVPYKLGKELRNFGSLQLHPIGEAASQGTSNFPYIKNVVVFKGSNHDTWPTKLFECEVTKLQKIMIFSNVRVNDDLKIDEGSIHYFLGLLVEMSEVWAKWAGKEMVVLETQLPHITEWFVEYNWKITTSASFDGSGGFRGTKIFLEEKLN